MQTFQTAAVVGLIDNMSGPLKELSAKAKQAARMIELMKFVSSGLNAYNQHINNAPKSAEQHLSAVRRIHEAWKGEAERELKYYTDAYKHERKENGLFGSGGKRRL